MSAVTFCLTFCECLCACCRSLEHSTILYESADLSPLLRIAWNKQDPNYLATIHTDANKAIIIDIRSVCMRLLLGIVLYR